LKGDHQFDREPAGAAPAGGELELITLEELEKRHVAAILRYATWNKTRAAKILGVSRPTLLKKIADYSLIQPAKVGDEKE
jgi:DNA-binding protein Fis